SETVQAYLHMHRHTFGRRTERLPEAQALVEREQPQDVAGVEVDPRVVEHEGPPYQAASPVAVVVGQHRPPHHPAASTTAPDPERDRHHPRRMSLPDRPEPAVAAAARAPACRARRSPTRSSTRTSTAQTRSDRC